MQFLQTSQSPAPGKLTKQSDIQLEGILRRLFVGGIWNTASAVVNRVLPNLLVIVLALLVKPAELGGYSYILASYTVLSLFADLGISYSLQKFIQESPGDLKLLASTSFVLRLLNSLGLALLCLGADSLWGALKGHSLLVALLLVSSAFQTAIYVINAQFRYKKACLIVMGRSFFWLGLAIALVAAGERIAGPVYALAVAFILFGVLTVVTDRSSFGTGFSWVWARKITQFGVLMTAASALTVVATQAGILAVAYLATETDVGIYRLAVTFGMIPLLASEGLILPLLPLVKKTLISSPPQAPELIRLLIRFLFAWGLFVLGIGFALAKPLISLIFGLSYQRAVVPIKILLGASLFGLVFTVLLSFFYMSDGLKFATRINGLVAAISLGGSIVLIPYWKTSGAAAALLLAFSGGLFFVLRRLRQQLRMRLEWRRYGISLLSMIEMTAFLFLFIRLARSPLIGLCGGIVLAPLLYIACLLLQGGLTRREIHRFLQITGVRAPVDA
jgi:O-antigen/teichoic acid export membrane protein